MKLFLGILMICLPIITFSQTKDPQNFDSKIQNVINDSTSNYYYPKLLAKAKESPSDITVQDSYYLYYGRKFQYENSKIKIRFTTIISSFQFAIMSNDCEQILNLGNQILERYPINLPALSSTSKCIAKLNSTDSASIQQRSKNLMSAILSTGDGKSIETAIKCANMDDSDYILQQLGLNPSQAQSILSNDKSQIFTTWKQDDKEVVIENLWKY